MEVFEQEHVMKRRATTLGVIAAVLLLFCSGCLVGERRGYGGRETYCYYPDLEVYYYSSVRGITGVTATSGEMGLSLLRDIH